MTMSVSIYAAWPHTNSTRLSKSWSTTFALLSKRILAAFQKTRFHPSALQAAAISNDTF
jgi:hypothetical protein